MVLVFLKQLPPLSFSSCVFEATTPPLVLVFLSNQPFCPLFFMFFEQSTPLCSYCVSLATNPLQILLCLTFVFGTHDPFLNPFMFFSWINYVRWLQVCYNMPLCLHSNSCSLYILFVNISCLAKVHTLVTKKVNLKFSVKILMKFLSCIFSCIG